MPGSTFSVSRHTPGCLRDLLRIRAAERRARIAVVPAPVVSIADELRAG
jgi:hypothetical protein